MELAEWSWPRRTNMVGVCRLEVPPDLGSGAIEFIPLEPGILLAVSNYSFKRPTLIKSRSSGPVMGFGFCLAGKIQSHPGCFKEPVSIRSLQSGFFSFPATEGSLEIMGDGRILRVVTFIDPKILPGLASDYPGRHLEALMRAGQETCRVGGTMNPDMEQAAGQILNCPYHGVTRKFFLQGKAMELVALKLSQLSKIPAGPSKKTRVKSGDLDRVLLAAEHLRSNLENPPNLNDLARITGMCRSKFHHCFCHMFGMTPFDYLRILRLETARRHLNQGGMNVTQAAYSVGYSSLSHFSKIFKDHFGFPPGHCLKPASMFQK